MSGGWSYTRKGDCAHQIKHYDHDTVHRSYCRCIRSSTENYESFLKALQRSALQSMLQWIFFLLRIQFLVDFKVCITLALCIGKLESKVLFFIQKRSWWTKKIINTNIIFHVKTLKWDSYSVKWQLTKCRIIKPKSPQSRTTYLV